MIFFLIKSSGRNIEIRVVLKILFILFPMENS